MCVYIYIYIYDVLHCTILHYAMPRKPMLHCVLAQDRLADRVNMGSRVIVLYRCVYNVCLMLIIIMCVHVCMARHGMVRSDTVVHRKPCYG